MKRYPRAWGILCVQCGKTSLRGDVTPKGAICDDCRIGSVRRCNQPDCHVPASNDRGTCGNHDCDQPEPPKEPPCFACGTESDTFNQAALAIWAADESYSGLYRIHLCFACASRPYHEDMKELV